MEKPDGWSRNPHWLPQLIAKATKYDIAASRFLEGHILDHIINGRVYSDIHPHRSDDGSGTCSCVFHIPIRRCNRCQRETKNWRRWYGVCFCQRKARCGPSPTSRSRNSDLLCTTRCCAICRAQKKRPISTATDPDADFHAMVADMTGLERESAKAANFAKIFGAGPEKFAEMIGKPLREARAIYRPV